MQCTHLSVSRNDVRLCARLGSQPMADELVVAGVGSAEMYFGKLSEPEPSGLLSGLKDTFACRCSFGRRQTELNCNGLQNSGFIQGEQGTWRINLAA